MGLELVKLNRLACGFNFANFRTASALFIVYMGRLFFRKRRRGRFILNFTHFRKSVMLTTEILLGIADIFVM